MTPESITVALLCLVIGVVAGLSIGFALATDSMEGIRDRIEMLMRQEHRVCECAECASMRRRYRVGTSRP